MSRFRDSATETLTPEHGNQSGVIDIIDKLKLQDEKKLIGVHEEQYRIQTLPCITPDHVNQFTPTPP